MRERYDWRIRSNMQLEYLLFIKVSLFVDAVGENLPVGRDFVGTVDEGVDGCCFITLGALTITVEVDTKVSGFMINGCIKTCVSFGDINI